MVAADVDASAVAAAAAAAAAGEEEDDVMPIEKLQTLGINAGEWERVGECVGWGGAGADGRRLTFFLTLPSPPPTRRHQEGQGSGSPHRHVAADDDQAGEREGEG